MSRMSKWFSISNLDIQRFLSIFEIEISYILCCATLKRENLESTPKLFGYQISNHSIWFRYLTEGILKIQTLT